MKKIILYVAVIGICAIQLNSPPPLHAAGYEFEGVGARQVSRGGAAIADANDWTSIYWNPGRIAKAAHKSGPEMGIEVFGGEAFEEDSNSLSSLPGLGAMFSKNEVHLKSILGALGAIFPVGKKGGIGVGFYTPLLQGSDFSDTSPTAPPVSLDFKGGAGILTWTVSGSYEITDKFSAGAGFNVLYGRIKNEFTIVNFPIPNNTLTSEQDADGFNLEGIFGLQYDVRESLSFGLVYRTGSDVNLEGDANANNTAGFLPDESSGFSYDLRHPPTWGVGVAFRPTKKLTLTSDFNRTLWHRFKSNVVYDNPGVLLTNRPNSFNWEDSWKFRLGAQFTLSPKWDLLAGYSFDHPAMDAASVDLATALDVPMHRFSTGVTHQWSEKMETILGIVAGSGTRTDGDLTYRLSGYQVMLEQRIGF